MQQTNEGEKIGSCVTQVGCLLTICITIPSILIVIALVMCGMK